MKIYLRREPNTINVEVFLFNRPNELRKGDVIESFNFNLQGECQVTREHHDYGSVMNMKPTFVLPEPEWGDLLKAFMELAQSEGVPNPSETFVKGKLEATQDHLKDMRKLLKL